jgi:hypothetical protein
MTTAPTMQTKKKWLQRETEKETKCLLRVRQRETASAPEPGSASAPRPASESSPA